MKINILSTLCFFFYLISSFKSYGQNPSDSVSKANIKTENYYSPFHEKIRGQTQKTVSILGHYIFLGLGMETDKNAQDYYSKVGFGFNLDYTAAFRSHLLSITGSFIEGDFFSRISGALMYGESIRRKYSFVALSGGLWFSDYESYAYPYSDYSQNFSIPLEIKACRLMRNLMGGGIRIKHSFAIPMKYSTTNIGISFVFGQWNIPNGVTEDLGD